MVGGIFGSPPGKKEEVADKKRFAKLLSKLSGKPDVVAEIQVMYDHLFDTMTKKSKEANSKIERLEKEANDKKRSDVDLRQEFTRLLLKMVDLDSVLEEKVPDIISDQMRRREDRSRY